MRFLQKIRTIRFFQSSSKNGEQAMKLKIIDDTIENPAEKFILPFDNEFVRVLPSKELRNIYYLCFKYRYIYRSNKVIPVDLILACQDEMVNRGMKF